MARPAAALLLALPLLAQTYRSGDATLTVRVTPANPVVADEVRLELRVAAPPGTRVELPDTAGNIDCAGVVDRESPDASSATFVLDPTGPGTCHVPPLTVRFGNSSITTQEMVFSVVSLIPPDETTPDIRDGLDPLLPPGQDREFAWWPAAVAGALIALAVATWSLVSRRRTPAIPEVPQTAEERTRKRLARLAAEPPAAARDFYFELSHILAGYLEERLGLRSTRCTSTELLAAVHGTTLITPPGRELLEALLEDCDYAKFSPFSPAGTNAAEAVACCRKIVDIVGAQAASRSRLLAEEAIARA